jgi:hypothetical protein
MVPSSVTADNDYFQQLDYFNNKLKSKELFCFLKDYIEVFCGVLTFIINNIKVNTKPNGKIQDTG